MQLDIYRSIIIAGQLVGTFSLDVDTTRYIFSPPLTAREELAAGDVRQASEKGWGAVDRLRRETGDPDVRRLFDVASVLHINFYED